MAPARAAGLTLMTRSVGHGGYSVRSLVSAVDVGGVQPFRGFMDGG